MNSPGTSHPPRRGRQKLTEEEEGDGILYGVITGVAKSGQLLFVTAKGFKFLLSGSAQNHSSRKPAVADLIKFRAKSTVHERDQNVEGLVDSFKIFEEQPPMFRSELKENKHGRPVTKISCELTFDYCNARGYNVFYNKWIGEVVDSNRMIPSPAANDAYQCAVLLVVKKFEEDPSGTWLITILQYYPLSQLRGPFKGFSFHLPNSKTCAIWCREVKKLLYVSPDVMSAFGHENVGKWTYFYVDQLEEVGRMELMNDENVETTVTEDGRFMTNLLCEYEGRSRDDYAVWTNRLVGNVFDTRKVTDPQRGDCGLLWCEMECRTGKGNEEWVVERVGEMKRMQRNEKERVFRQTRGDMEQRNERVGDVERRQGNQRIESRENHERVEVVEGRQRKKSERVDDSHEDDHLNIANGQLRRLSIGSGSTSTSQKSLKNLSSSSIPREETEEGGELSLADICRKLFKIPAVRRVTLEADPKSYALLMERLSGYGS